MSASEAVVHKLREFLSSRGEIREAYLFGSTARGSAAAHSDIDVAVTVDPAVLETPGFGYDAELGAELQAALQTPKVDVVVLNHAPPLLYHRVLRDGVRILARNLSETSVRETRALSRYFDYLPQLAKIAAAHAHRRSALG
jgi:predicted nucleotidyltransferase